MLHDEPAIICDLAPGSPYAELFLGKIDPWAGLASRWIESAKRVDLSREQESIARRREAAQRWRIRNNVKDAAFKAPYRLCSRALHAHLAKQ
jgi:hypothetical protein